MISSSQRHTSSYLPSREIRLIDTFHPPPSTTDSSAGIATSSVEFVLVVNLVVAVAGDARRRHIGLLHVVDGGAGKVVFAATLGVAGVGRVVIEGGDFGNVLAVGLAPVLDGL